MGANYDLIVCRSAGETDAIECATDFLLSNGFNVKSVGPLESIEVDDDKAILLSPLTNGWIEMVALPSALRSSIATWFQSNPLAIHLSVENCIHLWSLDSGYAAGYSIYSAHQKLGGESVFSKKARSHDELMDGVPAPKQQETKALSNIFGTSYDFSVEMSQYSDLELGIASLASRLGFAVHLIDFYEAVDDRQGIAVVDRARIPIDLAGWNAIIFAD